MTLIIYLYSGIAEFATGGLTSIDGFTSLTNCEAAMTTAKQTLKHYDWAQCLRTTK
jgi:hypothetical protein